MTKNSKKAWQIIKHMNDINATANQVENGKSAKSGFINKKEIFIRDRDSEQNSFQLEFTIFELNKSLKEIKNGKVPNEIMTE